MARGIFQSALLAILVSMLFYGFFPVAFLGVRQAGIETSAFLVGIHIVGFGFIAALFLVLRSALDLNWSDILRPFATIKRSSFLLAGMVFNTTAEVLLFTAIESSRRIQASVLYELWPIVFLILTAVFRPPDDGGVRLLHDKLSSAILFIIGAMGLMLVSISSVSISDFGDIFLAETSTIFGILAGVSMGLSAFFTTSAIRDVRKDIETDKRLSLKNPAFVAAMVNLFWFRLVSIGIALSSASSIAGSRSSAMGASCYGATIGDGHQQREDDALIYVAFLRAYGRGDETSDTK
ncbi:MAG: hypothetical protein AAGO57_02840 [Pseudomonadota bacterium]